MIEPNNTLWFKVCDYATNKYMTTARVNKNVTSGDNIILNGKTYSVIQVSGCDLIVIDNNKED